MKLVLIFLLYEPVEVTQEPVYPLIILERILYLPSRILVVPSLPLREMKFLICHPFIICFLI
jgi:hypothetical protein